MRDISMQRVNATRDNIFGIIKSPTLTHEQKVASLAGAADSLLEVLDLPEGLDELLNVPDDQKCICDLNEGHAPLRPRYIIPNYEKFMREPDRRGRARIQLDHRPSRTIRGDRAFGQRLGVVRDGGDDALTIDENHIERDIGVLHPHGDRAVFAKGEQHPAIFRHVAAKHQPARLLFGRAHDFYAESIDPGFRDELEPLELRRRSALREKENGENQRQKRLSEAT